MGLADILSSELVSRTVRSQVSENGIRTIETSLDRPTRNDSGNIVDWVFDAGKNLVGFIMGSVGKVFQAFSFSATALFSFFVQVVQFVYNFDWNISDAAIDAQVKTLYNQLAGQLGSFAGTTFGWLACGFGSAAAIFAFNEPLGAYILKEVGEEAFDEIASSLSALISTTFRSVMMVGSYQIYKNVRRVIRDSGKPIVRALFGDKVAEASKSWGKAGAQPWSFAKAVNDAVEAIPNDALENFVEEFLEESADACIEAGYVVAGAIDSYTAQQQLNRNAAAEEVRYVEITPDRSNERERVVLAGNHLQVREQIVQTITQHQVLDNRDIGAFVGEPVEEYLRARVQKLRIHIIMYSVPTPPWRRLADGQEFAKAEITIPDVKRSQMEWEKIKLAIGGSNGYMYGRFRCNVDLDTGRSITAYAESKIEGDQLMTRLLTLTEGNYVNWKNTEEEKKANKPNKKKEDKPNVRVYPAYMTVLNQALVSPAAQGHPTLSGKYRKTEVKIPLWYDTKPDNFDELITELFRTPGADITTP